MQPRERQPPWRVTSGPQAMPPPPASVKRIGLYLALEPSAGGAYQYSLLMLSAVAALPRERYFPIAVCAHSGWRDIASAYGLDVHDTSPGRLSSLVTYAWRKAGLPIGVWRRFAPFIDPHLRTLRSLHVDLWIYPAQDPMAYLLPEPALGVVHDLMHRYEPHFPEVSGYRMRERHYVATCRYARGVIVESVTGARHLTESYGIAADRVHPVTMVAPSYIYDAREPSDLAARYPLPPKFFFYPAQFWTHKNHVRLLQAAAQLACDLPDIHFVFVGAKKNGYEEVIRVSRELNLADRVHILGYLPNEYMAAFYRRARALVMPTFFGPSNIPPLEAMVVGCPIALSGTHGMPEQCGDAAIYFDPTSVQEIARSMAALWTDDELCERLGAHGKARSARYTQAAFNERLGRIVDDVCGGT